MPEGSNVGLGFHTSHLSAGNDGASQRCTQEVSLLVDGIALNSTEAELVNELLAKILDDPAVNVSAWTRDKLR